MSNDSDGLVLPDIEAVRREATLAAREMMADAILQGLDISDDIFRIEDDQGDMVMEVPFRSTIAPPL